MEFKMKKAIGIILLIATLLGAVLSLSACAGKDDGVPEGMQLAQGGEAYGYYLYVPEEWTVANYGKVGCAFVSKLNTTSVSLAEAELPEGELTAYFEAELAKLPFETTVGAVCEPTTAGNADKAYRYTYGYTYGEANMLTMQVFIYHKDSFYIFTYTSPNEEYTDGSTYYDSFMEKAVKILENLRFTEKVETSDKAEYPRDEDGYILVSDKKVSGFELYVPDSYAVDFSSGMVSVTREDGTNINVSKATYTGVSVDEYWKHRKEELEPLCDRIEGENGEGVSSITEINPGSYVDMEKNAYAYEYTYVMGGTKYHVYQVMIVSGMNGYVFTYTAYDELYAAHLDEAKTVLNKIGF